MSPSSSNTTPSDTSSTPTPVATTVPGVPSPAPLNPWCPFYNGSVVTPYDASGTSIRFNNEFAQSFQMLCNTYYPAGQGINPGQRDIMVMYTPDMVSFDPLLGSLSSGNWLTQSASQLTCITLCAEYNAGYSDAVGDDIAVGGGICVGVALVKSPTEFCYLKNATGINDTTAANGGQPVDSAILVGNVSQLSTIKRSDLSACTCSPRTKFSGRNSRPLVLAVTISPRGRKSETEMDRIFLYVDNK